MKDALSTVLNKEDHQFLCMQREDVMCCTATASLEQRCEDRVQKEMGAKRHYEEWEASLARAAAQLSSSITSPEESESLPVEYLLSSSSGVSPLKL